MITLKGKFHWATTEQREPNHLDKGEVQTYQLNISNTEN